MSFVADLSFPDLERLRKVCAGVHRENMFRSGKPYAPMDPKQIDAWIESMGPKVREQRIKIAVDNGRV